MDHKDMGWVTQGVFSSTDVLGRFRGQAMMSVCKNRVSQVLCKIFLLDS